MAVLFLDIRKGVWFRATRLGKYSHAVHINLQNTHKVLVWAHGQRGLLGRRCRKSPMDHSDARPGGVDHGLSAGE